MGPPSGTAQQRWLLTPRGLVARPQPRSLWAGPEPESAATLPPCAPHQHTLRFESMLRVHRHSWYSGVCHYSCWIHVRVRHTLHSVSHSLARTEETTQKTKRTRQRSVACPPVIPSRNTSAQDGERSSRTEERDARRDRWGHLPSCRVWARQRVMAARSPRGTRGRSKFPTTGTSRRPPSPSWRSRLCSNPSATSGKPAAAAGAAPRSTPWTVHGEVRPLRASCCPRAHPRQARQHQRCLEGRSACAHCDSSTASCRCHRLRRQHWLVTGVAGPAVALSCRCAEHGAMGVDGMRRWRLRGPSTDSSVFFTYICPTLFLISSSFCIYYECTFVYLK
ncbi:uncharacterized protein [Dermacentor albipictus]|uniref:uncharacterized protein isoform X1 n=1 Tax=Dermacentor albipictus TaxID=60249 RepID=UPI0038FD1B9A